MYLQENLQIIIWLQWVYRNSNFAKGITYFSCIDDDDLRKINGYNIVIPAINFNRKGFCKDLIKSLRFQNQYTVTICYQKKSRRVFLILKIILS